MDLTIADPRDLLVFEEPETLEWFDANASLHRCIDHLDAGKAPGVVAAALVKAAESVGEMLPGGAAAVLGELADEARAGWDGLDCDGRAAGLFFALQEIDGCRSWLPAFDVESVARAMAKLNAVRQMLREV